MFISMFHSITLQAPACKTDHCRVKACRRVFLAVMAHDTVTTPWPARRKGLPIPYYICSHVYIQHAEKRPTGASCAVFRYFHSIKPCSVTVRRQYF